MPGSPRGQPAWGGGGMEFAINVVESNLALVRQFDRFAASKRQIFKATDSDCVRGNSQPLWNLNCQYRLIALRESLQNSIKGPTSRTGIPACLFGGE